MLSALSAAMSHHSGSLSPSVEDSDLFGISASQLSGSGVARMYRSAARGMPVKCLESMAPTFIGTAEIYLTPKSAIHHHVDDDALMSHVTSPIKTNLRRAQVSHL